MWFVRAVISHLIAFLSLWTGLVAVQVLIDLLRYALFPIPFPLSSASAWGSIALWALVFAVVLHVPAWLIFARHYSAQLIGKYLLKRRIAWWSLLAVTLCTTMVLVVLSVMGGWLEMFKSSFHGLTGDVIVEARSLSGFRHYEEMLAEIGKLDEVEAALPTIGTFGIVNIDSQKTAGVQVLGFDIERIGQVHRFPDSLYRQRKMLLEMAEKPDINPIRKQLLIVKAAMPPQFKLRTETEVPLEAGLPPGVTIDADLARHYRYDPKRKSLVILGVMTNAERDRLKPMSDDQYWQEAVELLYDLSGENYVDYRALRSGGAAPTGAAARADPTKRPAMIPGGVILGLRKDLEGNVFHDPYVHRVPAKLTVMGMEPPGSGFTMDVQNKTERIYWVIDDSWTGIWQYDANVVYVPFDVLQNDLGMGERTEFDKDLGRDVKIPARTTDIQVKIRPGYDLNAARDRIREVVEAVAARHGLDPDQRFSEVPNVETWEEDKALYIDAIRKETLLVTFLFGIISLVAVFLILCIFYMIVVEKTKDIGIVKSVGASAGGVASIFVGYGGVIGGLGALLGWWISFLIVHYINEIHTGLGKWFQVQIWNPEVYQFDRIPNTMTEHAVIIVPIFVVASILGGLLPAVRAALMNPVEALRWE